MQLRAEAHNKLRGDKMNNFIPRPKMPLAELLTLVEVSSAAYLAYGTDDTHEALIDVIEDYRGNNYIPAYDYAM